MGTKHDRATKELDREELAKLARQATGEQPVVRAPEVPQSAAADEPSAPRTTTLQDPLTSALMAEVARNSRTRDFEPDEDVTPVPHEAHPVLQRRPR